MPLNALRFGAKCPCVLVLNARQNGAKCSAKCRRMRDEKHEYTLQWYK